MPPLSLAPRTTRERDQSSRVGQRFQRIAHSASDYGPFWCYIGMPEEGLEPPTRGL